MQERKNCFCPNFFPFFQHQGQKGEPGDITDVSYHNAAPLASPHPHPDHLQI